MLTSCVATKKYTELESQYKNNIDSLKKVSLEKDKLEGKFSKIEKRVSDYNEKVYALQNFNSILKEENDKKLDMVGETVVVSNAMKVKMRETLKNIDSKELALAKTFTDSMNLAVGYNLKKSINFSSLEDANDFDVNIDRSVVMISIADNLLFNSGSAEVKNKAYVLLEQLAKVMKSELSTDIMVEGHTDSRSIKTSGYEDNWDLSVKRATAIVRILESKYGISGARLIASGRGSSVPLLDNLTKENRARNRRTRIVLLLNLNKFFSLLTEE